MIWIILILSGLMETGCIISLKYSDGFTNKIPILLYSFFGLISAYLLSVSLKFLPMGLAFLIWMSISAVGVVIAEYLLFGMHQNPIKIFFMALIFIGIIGLKYLEG